MSILRLKEILKEKGVTGKDLSHEIGISETAMSNIVKGQSLPRQEVLIQIAEVLDVDIRELFYPTKQDDAETIYVKRGGEFVSVGKIQIN